MYRFWPSITREALTTSGARRIVEVGMGMGGQTRLLLSYCKEHGGSLDGIDPAPACDPHALEREYGDTFRFHRAPSLDVLPSLQGYDTIFLDGDHNWHVVTEELLCIGREALRTGRFPLTLLHDTEWPWGRRDLYYDPSTVPAELRHPHRKQPIRPGLRGAAPYGFGGTVEVADEEGGPRNGVRTAVEDFLGQWSGEPLESLFVPGFFGLGILVPRVLLERAPALGSFLQTLRSPALQQLLADVETDRLQTSIEHAECDARSREAQDSLWQEIARLKRLLEASRARPGPHRG